MTVASCCHLAKLSSGAGIDGWRVDDPLSFVKMLFRLGTCV